MLSQEEIINVLKKQSDYLNLTYGVGRIGLFGSFAKRKQTETSDLDLIVEFSRPIGFKFIDLSDYLEKLIGCKLDILTPEGLKAIRVNKVAENIKKEIVYV